MSKPSRRPGREEDKALRKKLKKAHRELRRQQAAMGLHPEERPPMPNRKSDLQTLFSELESLQHGDTLNRLLARIEVESIQQTTAELVQRLIRNKKFARYLVDRCYLVAIDGTQKLSRDVPFSCQALQRTRVLKDGETKTQYYVYVLEANLVLTNGH